MDLTRVICHPVRRGVLRRLHIEDRQYSALELATKMGLPVECMDYHLRVLQWCRATKSIETQAIADPTAALHQSAVSADGWLVNQLAATKVRDETSLPPAAWWR
jgi:predicted transcriptional regulator